MFSDPKDSFSVCQKNFFLIQSKVNIFHQIQPRYIPNVRSITLQLGQNKFIKEDCKQYSAVYVMTIT